MSTTNNAGLLGSDIPLAEAYDLALVDLDGVTYKGHLPIDHAAPSLTSARALGQRLIFVTNNASRTPEEVAQQLTKLDIPSNGDDVMTAAQACAALLGTRLAPRAKVLVIGGDGLLAAVREAGFEIVASAEDQPEAVAQGFAPTLTWEHLAEAAYAVSAGAWHVASNGDLSLPTARGYAPGNGALVAAVAAATGVKPVSAGKPAPTMYQLAAARIGAKNPLVVGDRLDTDLGGARAAGYPGLHVLTGVSLARDAVLAEPWFRPNYIGADLRALTSPHPAPIQLSEGWWECNGRAARVVDEGLQLDGSGPTGIDAVRAACAAAWAAVDEAPQAMLDPGTIPEFTFGKAGNDA
ncbi:MAG: HAD-IIA family hydrolase [Promicromonosporaceae bacterium]|nr:HAD-IIA family hydrolase [Promicromonosporaceae bacterium]